MTVNDEWVADLVKMTCRNKKNNIVILFRKINGSLIGEIKNLPMKIVIKWATEGRGNISIKNTVTEAEFIFIKAYLEQKWK
jgi:hypothetical protein